MLLQLHLEEKYSKCQLPSQAKSQLISFLSQLNLPTSIEAIGLKNVNSLELKKACKFACKDDSDIHKLPFSIKEKDLLNAMQSHHRMDKLLA